MSEMKSSSPILDVEKIRKDFPILSTKIRGKNLIYFDNAASAQKPIQVISAMEKVYREQYANIHRGIHFLSSHLTAEYEKVRNEIANFLGAKNTKEIIFTRGTTESVNLVATAWGRKFVQAGDTVVVTALEHHSNFVAWQQLAIEQQAKFEIVPFLKNGLIDLDALEKVLKTNSVKILAFTMMSNVLGIHQDVFAITTLAKKYGATVFVDAAQGIVHSVEKISELGPIDFLAFSSHKIYGPTGIGILWGKESILEKMNPYQFGGDMIEEVGDSKTSWNQLPWKFEAGTPAIVEGIGFAEAIRYINSLGRENILAREAELLNFTLEKLAEIPGIKIFSHSNNVSHSGRKNKNAPVISFLIDNIHPHDLGSFLDSEGIAIRVGHHCAQPLMRRLGIAGTCRVSMAFYNTQEEVFHLQDVLKKSLKVFL